MSLLLDALKRAEQEKLARQGEPGSAEDSPPAPPPSAPERPLSRSTAAFELEAIESARPSMLMPASGPAFSSPSTKPSPSSKAQPSPKAAPAPAAAAAGDRANAQAIFAAKVPRAASGAPSKAPILVGAAVVVLLVIAGGAYVWLQLNAINTPRLAPAARPAPPPPPPTSSSVIRNVTPITSMPSPAEPPTPLMPPAAPVPPPASGVAPGAAPQPRPRHDPPTAVASRAPAANNADDAVAGLLQESAQRSATGPAPLRLAKSSEQPRIAADVSAGYDWLVRGDLQAARRSYLAALASDPNSIDALLGLATVEARSGERPAAARSYRRVLAADPRNTAALAGLAAVSDYTRPEALESSLQADIRSYPNNAALRMALGNLYASQLRWTEAQSVFFEALRLEPGNPEVLFNLAVALDNLKQHRLAAEYYGRALAQANGRVVQFDTRAAERRAADLKR